MRDIALIVHFIGLVMGLGTAFSHMFLGIAASKLDAAEARKLHMHSFALSRMGHIGLALLILSGGYLMTPYWGMLTSTPLLMLKLALVIVLSALIGIISAKARKAREGETDAQLRQIAPIGRATLVIGVLIVVLAVYIFH